MSWAHLPDELLIHVFGYLDLHAQATASAVCRAWHSVSQDRFIWKDKYRIYAPLRACYRRLPPEDSQEQLRVIFKQRKRHQCFLTEPWAVVRSLALVNQHCCIEWDSIRVDNHLWLLGLTQEGRLQGWNIDGAQRMTGAYDMVGRIHAFRIFSPESKSGCALIAHRSNLWVDNGRSIQPFGISRVGRVRAIQRCLDSHTRMICIGTDIGWVSCWDLQAQTCVSSMKADRMPGGVRVIEPTDWPEILVVAGMDGCIRVWDARLHLAAAGSISAHHQPIWDLRRNPDGNLFASGSVDRRLCVWDLRRLDTPVLEKHFTSAVVGVGWWSVARGSPFLLAGTKRNGVRLWDLSLAHYHSRVFRSSDTFTRFQVIHHGAQLLIANRKDGVAFLLQPKKLSLTAQAGKILHDCFV